MGEPARVAAIGWPLLAKERSRNKEMEPLVNFFTTKEGGSQPRWEQQLWELAAAGTAFVWEAQGGRRENRRGNDSTRL